MKAKKLPVSTHGHVHAQGKALGNLPSTQTFLYVFLTAVLTFLAVFYSAPFTFVPVVGPPPSAVTQQCLCFRAGIDREVQFS